MRQSQRESLRKISTTQLYYIPHFCPIFSLCTLLYIPPLPPPLPLFFFFLGTAYSTPWVRKTRVMYPLGRSATYSWQGLSCFFRLLLCSTFLLLIFWEGLIHILYQKHAHTYTHTRQVSFPAPLSFCCLLPLSSLSVGVYFWPFCGNVIKHFI